MTPRRVVAATLTAAALVGAAIGGTADTAATVRKHHQDKPRCTRSVLPGEYRCVLPTGRPVGAGRPAVVYVQTWEDGSARAYPVDPDRRAER